MRTERLVTSMRELHIDPDGVDWPRVDCSASLLHQRFRYEYSRPITALRHRLVITPPPWHADQRLLERRIRISPGTGVIRSNFVDEFGNTVIDVRARSVEESITFEAWFVVERLGPERPYRETVSAAGQR